MAGHYGVVTLTHLYLVNGIKCSPRSQDRLQCSGVEDYLRGKKTRKHTQNIYAYHIYVLPPVFDG